MTMRIVPINVTQARAYVEKHHSHHHAPVGGFAAVAVESEGQIVCVAMLSRPVARLLNAVPTNAEVNRVASDGTTPHAASMAIGAISRAAFALGYRRLVSYTLLGEAGTSYRAAGWWPAAESGGGEWFRESHPEHSAEKTTRPERKIRWEYGPDAAPRSAEVDALVRSNVGKIIIGDRPETLPLFRGRS